MSRGGLSTRRAEVENMISCMVQMAKRLGLSEDVARPIAEVSTEYPDRYHRQVAELARTQAIAQGRLCKNCMGETGLSESPNTASVEPLSLRSRLSRIPEDTPIRGKSNPVGDDPLKRL